MIFNVMKKFIFLFVFVLFGLSGNAQWYCSMGVTNIDDLSEEQLNLAYSKAEKMIKNGQLMTFGGLIVGLTGWLISDDAVKSWEPTVDPDVGNGYELGLFMIIAGFGTAGVGVPLWIVGNSRKTDIEIALIKYKQMGRFDKDNKLGVGLTVKF